MSIVSNAGLSERFAGLAEVQASALYEFDAALLVNEVLDPQLDVGAVRASLDALLTPQQQTPWEYLASLGFAGNAENYDDFDNSRIDWVLAERRGLPITLAVVLVTVAKQRGLPAVGLNAPGHFLARVDQDVIDPFTMRTLPLAQAAPEATGADIALRMLNNLKAQYTQSQDLSSVLALLDYQAAILEATGPAELLARLLVERGECWRMLGVPELSRAAYEEALAGVTADSEIGRFCRARLDDVGETDNPAWH